MKYLEIGMIGAVIAVAFVSAFTFSKPANAQTRLTAGWAGLLMHSGPQDALTNSPVRFSVFRDTNGCEYIVARAGNAFNYSDASTAIAITPRIEPGKREPFCRTN